MGLIVYGHQQIPIGIDEFFVKCPCCETYSWADVMIFSHYFHVYFVPLFPTDKDANVVCKKCGLKRNAISFDESLINDYDGLKGKCKHPWFTYAGLAVIIFIIISIIVAISSCLL